MKPKTMRRKVKHKYNLDAVFDLACQLHAALLDVDADATSDTTTLAEQVRLTTAMSLTRAGVTELCAAITDTRARRIMRLVQTMSETAEAEQCA